MTRHERFEWDEAKSEENFRKHGVTLEQAADVLADLFGDQFHVEDYDADHSTEAEDRWMTRGSSPMNRELVLLGIWTPRRDEEGNDITRIISSRTLTRQERNDYENEIRE